ncbi:MAG TPA: BON domain-containing protein [Pyrinomonadaceae bacterium]|nr:BON domain-containing protein [Pyrinomonadaceae bacterium]
MMKKMLALVATVLIATSAVVAAPKTVDKSEQSYQQISKKVRKELVTLPYFGVFDNLAYKIEGDTVTLYGQVVRPSTRKDAERRVARIQGVERVVNQIEVLPLSSFDDSVRISTYRALARTGGLYRYLMGANPSLRIIVNRGHVTLEGVVANEGDRNMANIVANGVPGAFSVKNNLRTDREIEREELY